MSILKIVFHSTPETSRFYSCGRKKHHFVCCQHACWQPYVVYAQLQIFKEQRRYTLVCVLMILFFFACRPVTIPFPRCMHLSVCICMHWCMHLMECRVDKSTVEAKIINRCLDLDKLLTREALHISRRRPGINQR